MTTDELLSESYVDTYDEETYDIEYTIKYYDSEIFECNNCHFSLKNPREIIAAGLQETFEIKGEREKMFYDDYCNE